jgi:hypothetical protein
MTTTANKAIICYDNVLTSPLLTSVVATTEQSGFSVANSYDWYTTSYWSPTPTSGYHYFTATFSSPVTADYLAIYRHNLGTVGGIFYLEYSHDGLAWSLATPSITGATDNELKINMFTAVTARYWRVVFYLPTATPFYVGVVMLGRKLPLYRGMVGGFVVPRHGRKNTIMNQKTEGGQFVGRVKTSQGAQSNVTFKTVPQQWVRDYWESFVKHAELKPFLFSWNHEFYPQDAAYCVSNGEIPDIAINENRYHDISLPVQCLLSGDTL